MFRIAVLTFLTVMQPCFGLSSVSIRNDVIIQSMQAKIKLEKLSTFKNAHKGAFSPDGKLLVLIGSDHADVVEIASGRQYLHIAPDGATMLGARFSPNGRRLAVAYKISENAQKNLFRVAIWDVSSAKEILSLPAEYDEWYRAIDDLSFSNDGELLASNLGGVARLWRTSDGGESRKFLQPDDNRGLQSQRVLLSPNGLLLAVAFKGEKGAVDLIRVWNLSNQKWIDLPTNVYRDWDFSSKSNLLAITTIERRGHADEHSAVEIWDVNAGRLVRTLEVPKDWRGAFVVAFSPDESIIGIGGYKRFGLFSLRTGALIADARHTGSGFFKDNEIVNQLSDIEFSPDGKLLLTGGNDGTVKLWRVVG